MECIEDVIVSKRLYTIKHNKIRYDVIEASKGIPCKRCAWYSGILCVKPIRIFCTKVNRRDGKSVFFIEKGSIVTRQQQSEIIKKKTNGLRSENKK